MLEVQIFHPLYLKGEQMADITMCRGTKCPKKDTCFRYTATPDSQRQSYFIEAPYGKVIGWDCMYYVPTEVTGTDSGCARHGQAS